MIIQIITFIKRTLALKKRKTKNKLYSHIAQQQPTNAEFVDILRPSAIITFYL